MNRWRFLPLWILTLGLLTGCVYDPPYYADPYSPAPWGYPPEPYPARGYAFRQPPPPPYGYRPGYRQAPATPYTYRHRRYEDRDNRLYRPDEDYRGRSRESYEEPVPQSRTVVPAPERRSEPQASSGEIPTATRGSKPGRVKIPFPPYSELDVTGLTPGSLAKDPTSGKVFRLPN
jgi:hypothetical protein